MGIQPVAKLGAPVFSGWQASTELGSGELKATWRQAWGSVNTALQPEHR